ncbi:lipopolysaccharide biosynthesis protein [Aestuariirhabdus litorea]|uniref:Lipopolysaccharide biosynthesis protein n=1 Tax=Aestuariirhabdus litorea TaxID=2528527 RepID=A0A3P3VPD0_9GAMM|nr:lipopolysaccharide biosynthesis protein [Aestuariirhabdus litorea]RRJ84612.1 lipopolysaccharide biosynthesis protein [Aestuariirhabdus litorea]RWW97838.1 lipopolysaccharide biosynthesis protein [Endozoicomonadaceae bacterium GTF-13]
MSLSQRIRQNTLWMFGGNIGQNLLAFASGIVLARLLAPEDFGMLVTIQIFTGAAGLVAAGGMGVALIQAKELNARDADVVFTVQSAICLLIFTAFYGIAPYFADWFNDPAYRDMLRVSALTFLIRPLSNIPTALLSRDQRMREIAVVRVLTLVVSASCSIYMATQGLQTWSLILGGLAGGLFQSLLLIHLSRWSPRYGYERKVARQLGWFGVKFATIATVIYARKQLENLITSYQLGAQQVGLLNKGSSLSEMPTKIVVSSAYQTLFRALSSMQDDKGQSIYLFRKSLILIQVISWPCYLGLAWLAEPFVLLVYGEKWLFCVPALQVFCLCALLSTTSMYSGAVVAAQNQLGKEVSIQLEATLIKLVAVLIGVQWGILGVALAMLPSFSYLTLRMAFLACRSLGAPFSMVIKSMGPAVLLNLLMIAALLLSDQLLVNHHSWLYLFATALWGALVYLLLVCLIPVPELRSESRRAIQVLLGALNWRRDPPKP